MLSALVFKHNMPASVNRLECNFTWRTKWRKLSRCWDNRALWHKSNSRFRMAVPLFNALFLSSVWEYYHQILPKTRFLDYVLGCKHCGSNFYHFELAKGCNVVSFGAHSTLEGDSLSSLKSYWQALELECCFNSAVAKLIVHNRPESTCLWVCVCVRVCICVLTRMVQIIIIFIIKVN